MKNNIKILRILLGIVLATCQPISASTDTITSTTTTLIKNKLIMPLWKTFAHSFVAPANKRVKQLKRDRLGATFVQDCTPKKKKDGEWSTELTFRNNNKVIATAEYTIADWDDSVELHYFQVECGYRDLGYGGEFFTLTMQEIADDIKANNYDHLSTVWWKATPLDPPLGKTKENMQKHLYTFYKKQKGAVVNEKTGYCNLDLAAAGYLT